MAFIFSHTWRQVKEQARTLVRLQNAQAVTDEQRACPFFQLAGGISQTRQMGAPPAVTWCVTLNELTSFRKYSGLSLR